MTPGPRLKEGQKMKVIEHGHCLEALGEPEYPVSVEVWLDEILETNFAEEPLYLGRESGQPFCLRPHCTDAECNRQHEEEV